MGPPSATFRSRSSRRRSGRSVRRGGTGSTPSPGAASCGEGGGEVGRRVIRGHRLAEVLLQQVLEVEEGEADRAACEFEHMLSEAVTESVCTYLGHPPVCPPGNPIPRGGCGARPAAEMEPLVVRLTEMRPGEEGRIVYIRGGAGRRLERLAGMGLVP